MRTKSADYLLALKGNQKSLHKEMALLFDVARDLDSHTTTDADHGRVEIRRPSVCYVVDWLSADRAGRTPLCRIGNNWHGRG